MVTTASGIEVIHWSNNPCDYQKVPVAGNTVIGVGAPITLTSGKAVTFITANKDTDTDEFRGLAYTGQDGSDSSGDTNYITVCARAVAKVTFSTAPAADDYIGNGVECDAGTAATQVYTFLIEDAGVNQCGWLMENGDGSTTTLRVLFDSFLVSHGAQVAGTGSWMVNAAE